MQRGTRTGGCRSGISSGAVGRPLVFESGVRLKFRIFCALTRPLQTGSAQASGIIPRLLYMPPNSPKYRVEKCLSCFPLITRSVYENEARRRASLMPTTPPELNRDRHSRRRRTVIDRQYARNIIQRLLASIDQSARLPACPPIVENNIYRHGDNRVREGHRA